jgi:hypothetical protein
MDMSTLTQIIYISRSATPPSDPAKGVDPVVARILAHSRTNNRKNALVGVLYFGDGCFFQCLEGEESAVTTLYAKLERDERHRDLQVISRKQIATPTFKDWSMKYVAAEKAMAALLRSKGMSSFDPYRFDAATIDAVIDLLHGEAEPVASAPEAPAPAPAVPVRKAPTTLKMGAPQYALIAVLVVTAVATVLALMARQ